MTSEPKSKLGTVRSARRARPQFEALEGRQLLATFTVTSVNDNGAGSLRQAIFDANSRPEPSTINFAIGSGPKSILPVTPLPTLANSITIDGTTQPGYAGTPIIQINGSQISDPSTQSKRADGLVITAGNCLIKGLLINLFDGNGIFVNGGGKNTIKGNYIGTDFTGQVSFPNTGDGIFIADSRNNQIGGTSAGDRNLISGNGGGGIDIVASSNSVNGGNVVQGNFIGTDVSGLLPLGNTFDGITINSGSFNTIGGTVNGAGNTIAFNGGDGVKVANFYSFSGQGLVNSILSNAITNNGNLGIDLLFGASSPVSDAKLNSVYPLNGNTMIEGSFIGTPNTTVSFQFFSDLDSDLSGAGEGRTLIGNSTATADSNGFARFSVTIPGVVDPGTVVTATATSAARGTSEFFENTIATANARADLDLNQYHTSANGYAGQSVVFNLEVRNNGPSKAHNVILTDTLPAGTKLVQVDTDQNILKQENGVVQIDLGDLAQGDSLTIRIEVIPRLAGAFTNTASVSSPTTDPSPANNSSKATILVTTNPNPPVVLEVRPVVGLRSINALVIRFNVPLDPDQALNAINYRVTMANRRNKFVTTVPLLAPVYDADALTVRLTPVHPFPLGKLFQLEIDGQGSAGVTDLGGNLLTGNTPAGPQGPYYQQFSRGYVSPLAVGSAPRRGAARLLQTVTRRQIYNGPASTLPANLS